MPYIDRDKIKYTGRLPIWSDDGRYQMGWVAAVSYREIEAIPIADVAPVRHAHWVKDKRFLNDHYYCSSCDGSALKNNYGEYNILSPYCPECGATMDEEVEEE